MGSRSVGLNIVIAGDAKGARGAFREVRGEVTGFDAAVSKARSTVRDLFLAYQGATGLLDVSTVAAGLGEAQATANQVFQEATAIVADYAQTTTDSLGISERAALNAANAYGGLLVNMGLGRDAAADWSTQLVGLAADLSAFWNTSRDDALTAIRSLLSGEMEPGKRYGIILSDLRLRQEALNLGIYDGTGILNQYQKAQASLSLIMKDTADAQGQAAREADGWTQRNARLAASFDDAKAKLGQGLLPTMQAATTVGIAFAEVWTKIPSQVQVGALALTGFLYLLPKLRAGLASGKAGLDLFRLGLMGVTQQGAGTSNALGSMLATIGPSGVAAGVAGLGLLTVSLAKVADQAAKSKQDVADLRALIQSGLSPMDAFAEQLARTWSGAEGGFSALEGSAKSLKAALDDVGVSTPDVIAALTGEEAQWERLKDRIGEALGLDQERRRLIERDPAAAAGEAEAERYGRTVRNLERMRAKGQEASAQFEQYKATMREAGFEVDDATGAIVSNTEATDEQTSAYERAVDALERVRDRRLKQIDTARALASAEMATKEALAELAEVQETAAGRGEEVADARAAVADSLDRERDAARGVVEAQRRLSDAQDDLNEAYATAAQRLRDKAVAAREAADAEAGAQISADRARKELERARAGGADELTIREKEQAVREADTAVVSAREKAREAARVADEARRVDEEVVRAKEAVADAARGVADAERQQADAREATAEAERRVQEIISDAKAKIADATKRVEDAVLAEAEAAGEAAGAQFGAAAGVKEHMDRLKELIPLLAPGSELRRNLEDTVVLLERLAPTVGSTGRPGTIPAGGGPGGGTIGYTGHLGRNAVKDTGGVGPVEVTQNLTLQGTPAEQRRAVRDAARRVGDEIARRVG